nr:hypothetical protein [Tanacetum cinerariifolium]
MDSLSPQVVSVAKLPILNPNEFDLWKIRIEQYFLMTDYSLWEVILNGDSPIPTRIVEGVLQPVAPTIAEQRLAHAKTLMEAIKKRFGGNTKTKKVQKTILKQQFETFTGSISEGLDQIHDRLQKLADLEEQSLDDLFNSLKICETKVKQSSSTNIASQNLDFVSSSHTDSTTDSISDAASVFVVCAKLHASPFPNIDVDDLEEIDLRWQMAMLTMRAKRFLQKTGINLGANGPTSMSFDMSKVECYNCHMKGYFARECRSSKGPRRPGAAEPHRRTSYQAEEQPANFALMDFSSSYSDNETGLEYVKARLLVYKQNEFVFEENIKLLNIEMQLRDTALATLRKKLNKAKKDRDNYYSSESNCESWPPSSLYDRHTIQQIETTIPAATLVPASPKSNSIDQRRNRKACFVCKSVDHLIKDCDFHTKKMAQPTQRNYAHRGHHKQYASLTHSKPQKHMVPTAVLTQSKPVSNTAVRPVSAALPNI